MRVEIPSHPKFYPPARGDKWGDGDVVAYGQNVDGSYWVRVQYPNGTATFDRCPFVAGSLSVGRFVWGGNA